MKNPFLSLCNKTISFLLIFVSISNAQIVQTDPPFSSRMDSFSIVFDASLGSGNLSGYSGTYIYAHTGVTIEGVGNWRNVIGTWGVEIPEARLTRIEGDLWRLNIGNPYDFYTVDTAQVITQLCFVFWRNNGSVQTEDIFLTLTTPGGIAVAFTNPLIDNQFGDPARSPYMMDFDSTLDIQAIASASNSEISELTLFLNDSQIASITNDSLGYTFVPDAVGIQNFKIVVEDTIGRTDSTFLAVMVMPDINGQARPEGTIDGINYINTTSVRLSLFAPYKENVFIIGDFNDWKVGEDYLMNREMVDVNNVYWWIDIENLTPGVEYAFQYLVDGQIRIADPYSPLVLHPSEDQYIPETVYPNLKDYPDGMTDFSVSVFQTAQQDYIWQHDDFVAPPKQELIIYELLIRDFLEAHNYQTLIDTLDYFENLGINAIELLPVNEFEGNESWGYNVAFHLALDKYYGTKNGLKMFIDECHGRGIAVIFDMVLNHAFGRSPLVRLYASGNYGPPTAQNPWLNVTATHPDNVGNDFNHESAQTQYFVDRVNRYWLGEFHFDGFRFDLSKGFMQTGSYYDYNAGRIALLKRMADEIWSFKENAYIIFEHWGDNAEEIELTNYGIMLWGHPNSDKNLGYYEATMGYHENNKSDFSWGYYGTRGWTYPHLVTKIESHDEERLMYRNLAYGGCENDPTGTLDDGVNSCGEEPVPYSVQNLGIALQRMKMAAAFFFTFPGPKMFWQFGEVGYDYSIFYDARDGMVKPGNDGAKLSNKPIRWDYYQDNDRRRLYDTYAALLKLRAENEAFRMATSVELSVSTAMKRIRISYPGLNAIIIGNFGVTVSEIDPNFFHGGSWYDYFSGDSISVGAPTPISLAAGEFHIYTDQRLESPDINPITAIEDVDFSLPINFHLSHNYPNPFNPVTKINYQLAHYSNVDLGVYNMLGQKVATLVSEKQNTGVYSVEFNGAHLASGIYFYTLKTGEFVQTKKMLLIK